MISQFSFFRSRFSLLTFVATIGTLTMQACQPSTEPLATPVLTILLEPSGPNIPIYDCVPVEGVKLTVTSPSPGMAKIEITGLVPYEPLMITIRAEGEDWSNKIEIWSIVADAYGTYATTEGLRVRDKGSPIEWQVQVIHARGVACATVEVMNP